MDILPKVTFDVMLDYAEREHLNHHIGSISEMRSALSQMMDEPVESFTDEQIYAVWSSESEKVAAGWLMFDPSSDGDLTVLYNVWTSFVAENVTSKTR